MSNNKEENFKREYVYLNNKRYTCTVKKLDTEKDFRHCRNWLLRVEFGHNVKTGGRIQKTKTVRGLSYSKAKEQLEGFVKQLVKTSGEAAIPKTFEQLVEAYIEHEKQATNQTAKNVAKHEMLLGAISRHIGKANLDELTEEHFTSALAAMREGDTASGRTASGTYLNAVMIHTKKVLAYARKKGYMFHNPVDLMETPKVDTKERTPLTNEEAEELLEKLTPNCCNHVALQLMLLAGLRAGETVIECWGDYDPVNMTLHVRGTKTKASDAYIPLNPILCENLNTWKQKQQLDLNEFGIEQNEETRIVSDALNQSIRRDSLTRWWCRNKAKYTAANITLHDLRHTFVTMLARNGMHPSAAQKLARHSDPRMTLARYTHFNVEQCREAANSLSNIFAPEAEKPASKASDHKPEEASFTVEISEQQAKNVEKMLSLLEFLDFEKIKGQTLSA